MITGVCVVECPCLDAKQVRAVSPPCLHLGKPETRQTQKGTMLWSSELSCRQESRGVGVDGKRPQAWASTPQPELASPCPGPAALAFTVCRCVCPSFRDVGLYAHRTWTGGPHTRTRWILKWFGPRAAKPGAGHSPVLRDGHAAGVCGNVDPAAGRAWPVGRSSASDGATRACAGLAPNCCYGVPPCIPPPPPPPPALPYGCSSRHPGLRIRGTR